MQHNSQIIYDVMHRCQQRWNLIFDRLLSTLSNGFDKTDKTGQYYMSSSYDMSVVVIGPD